MKPRRMAPGLAVGAVLALAGWTAGSCGTPAPAPADVPGTAAARCAAVQGQLAAGTHGAGLAGSYRLSLVATSGARAGSTATGSLRLRPFGTAAVPVTAAPGARYPLFGGADVALAEVGALAPGDVKADNAAAPGVLAIEWEQAGRTELTLRMGADANHGDQLRFDGTRMALFVSSITPERFAGRWESGGGEQRANGYFCADRV